MLNFEHLKMYTRNVPPGPPFQISKYATGWACLGGRGKSPSGIRGRANPGNTYRSTRHLKADILLARCRGLSNFIVTLNR